MASTASIRFIITGISPGAYGAMHSKSSNGLTKFTASGTITIGIAATNSLTACGVGLTIKSNLVMFRGLNHSLDMDAHSGGEVFYSDVYMDAIFKVQG